MVAHIRHDILVGREGLDDLGSSCISVISNETGQNLSMLGMGGVVGHGRDRRQGEVRIRDT